MNIQIAYNDWSSTYDRDRNLTRDLDREITRKILRDLPFKSAIEIGCGTGKNTIFLAEIAEKVHAIDFSEKMLEQALEKVNSGNVIFTLGDITKPLPCRDRSADLITCNLVLEHIQNLAFIFSEANRILTKDGYLFISELHPFRQYRGTKANFQREEDAIEIQAFIHHLSDFTTQAKNNNFMIDDFQ
ncbi:MAG: class I SAM-dependent methyltransferase, partial [Cyanobacteria bacterium P01_E01_bin.42]